LTIVSEPLSWIYAEGLVREVAGKAGLQEARKVKQKKKITKRRIAGIIADNPRRKIIG
jgi:hypothetical protein